MVNLSNNDKLKVNQAVKDINPLGKTPLASLATVAINSLREHKIKATIILITDGIESCDGDICDVILKAKSDGIDFKLHIVGFGLKEDEKEQLVCAAKAGEGRYYDAADAGGLAEVLNEATSETVDEPDGNFSIYAEKNGQPIDAWIRAYKTGTKEEVDVARTYRDTSLLYLPVGKYDLVVQPLENTRIKAITLTVESVEGKIRHQTVSFDGGKINLITLNNGEGWDCTSKVKTQTGEVVGGSRTYGRPKLIEVDPGTYNIELVALRMKGLETSHKIENVTVQSGKIVDVTHNFESGIAMIGVQSAGTLVDAMVKITDKSSKTTVAGGRTYTSSNSNPKPFILNPGTYEVTVKAVKKEYAGKQASFTITVKAEETVSKITSF